MDPERSKRARDFLAWRALREFNEGIRELAVDEFMDAEAYIAWDPDDEDIDG